MISRLIRWWRSSAVSQAQYRSGQAVDKRSECRTSSEARSEPSGDVAAIYFAQPTRTTVGTQMGLLEWWLSLSATPIEKLLLAYRQDALELSRPSGISRFLRLVGRKKHPGESLRPITELLASPRVQACCKGNSLRIWPRFNIGERAYFPAQGNLLAYP